MRHQLDRTPFDETLAALVRAADTPLSGVARPAQPLPDLVLCPWVRVGDQVINTIGIAARFDPATEVTLDELRIEMPTRSTRPPTGTSGKRDPEPGSRRHHLRGRLPRSA